MPPQGSSLDITQPFTVAQAVDEGWTRYALRTEQFRPVIHGVYISSSIPDTLVVRAKAAVLIAPPYAVVSHESAARLWCPQGPRSANVHISFSYHAFIKREEVSTHRFTYRLETTHRHGILVTSPAMTFMHLAVRLELVELVVFGDQLVKRGHITPEDLVRYAENWEHHGRAAGLRAAKLVRAGVDSAPETRLRLLIILAGLPEPTINHVMYRVDGSIRYRIELVYGEVLLAIEYDGRWHDEPTQKAYDEARRKTLTEEGWTFIVLRAEDLYETPDQTLLRIIEALRSFGITVANPDLTDYRRYFSPILVA
ncbi:MAG: DUF559 domain-containing protein [Actinomycetia bacterium]|nr:DUF559 domain-containing protein [Actinomycetes bacterium]